jgi:hypothetical protein
MTVGAILYLWRHPFFARMQWKQKISSKICAHAMETLTICHNYRIYHKNRICKHAPLDVVQWLGGVLCYLYELFKLFLSNIYAICAKKIEPQLWLASRMRVGCWTSGFDWHAYVGRFDLMHGGGRTRPHAPSCWVRSRGCLGLPAPIRSPGLPIFLYIYSPGLPVIRESPGWPVHQIKPLYVR